MTEIFTEPTTASSLVTVVSSLRRALRRRLDRTGGVSSLTEAQRELVRTVRRQPGIRVGEAATELHLAANTVSTLVSGLCAAGWLRREPDPGDRRSGRLFLSTEAEARVAEWRDRRIALINGALDALDADDRERIARALPALERVVRLLQEDQ